ncbi:unnamed protein product [Lota lota]
MIRSYGTLSPSGVATPTGSHPPPHVQAQAFSLNQNNALCLPVVSADNKLVWVHSDSIAQEVAHAVDILHGAFGVFPYPTPKEMATLAWRCSLHLDQVRVWFMLQRLHYGISWDCADIRQVRKTLLGSGRRRPAAVEDDHQVAREQEEEEEEEETAAAAVEDDRQVVREQEQQEEEEEEAAVEDDRQVVREQEQEEEEEEAAAVEDDRQVVREEEEEQEEEEAAAREGVLEEAGERGSSRGSRLCAKKRARGVCTGKGEESEGRGGGSGETGIRLEVGGEEEEEEEADQGQEGRVETSGRPRKRKRGERKKGKTAKKRTREGKADKTSAGEKGEGARVRKDSQAEEEDPPPGKSEDNASADGDRAQPTGNSEKLAGRKADSTATVSGDDDGVAHGNDSAHGNASALGDPALCGSKAKRPAARAKSKTKAQLDQLHRAFLACQYPNRRDYDQLSARTGLHRSDLTQWFCDTRYFVKSGQPRWMTPREKQRILGRLRQRQRMRHLMTVEAAADREVADDPGAEEEEEEEEAAAQEEEENEEEEQEDQGQDGETCRM